MNKVVKGTIWNLIQQYSSYIIKFAVQIVLARLLMPSEFGLITEMLVFTNICETFAVSGLGKGLIQKIDTDDEDYSTVLCFSMAISALSYCIVFFAAPMISSYYHHHELIILLRVYSICIFLDSFQSIQLAYVTKHYLFKLDCIFGLIAAIVGGLVAIVLAYYGLGVWALVVQGLVTPLVLIVLFQFKIKWNLSLKFNFNRFKGLFPFSWKVLVSSLIGTVIENVYNMFIGNFYGDEMLGYYNRGNTYSNIIVGQTRTAMMTTTLPYFSEQQKDDNLLLNAVRKTTRLSCFVSFPLVFGLMAVATGFVSVFLTDKWLPAVFFLRLECAFYGVLSLNTGIRNGLLAKGRSDLGMFTELIKLVLLLVCIFTLNSKGIYVLCVARIVVSILSCFISMYFARIVLNYKIAMMLFDAVKPLAGAAIMGILTYGMSFIKINQVLLLFIQVLFGVCIYGFYSFLFMRDDVYLIINRLRKK